MEVHGAQHGVAEDLGVATLMLAISRGSACAPLGVDAPGGVEHLEAELGQLDPGVGDLVLGQLFAGQQLALGGAAERGLAEHVEQRAHCAHGAHGVVQTPATETGLRDGEGLPLTPEQILGGHRHGVVAHVGVVAAPRGHSPCRCGE